MVLLFAVLFGVFTVASVFADPPPNGRYEATGGAAILLHYMPARQLWEVSIFDLRGNLVGSYETTRFRDEGRGNSYYIGFTHNGSSVSLMYSPVNGYLSVTQGNLPASRYRLAR